MPTKACPLLSPSSASATVRRASLVVQPLLCADTRLRFVAGASLATIQDDGSSVVTERVYSCIKEVEAMDIDPEGEATLNIENDLMMAGACGEVMSLQPSVINARAAKMFTGGDGAPRQRTVASRPLKS